MAKVRIVFICMGNICRSPTAEGVFQALIEQQGLANQIEIDSAGTHAYHVAEAPDIRAQQAAKERGIDISKCRARRVRMADFDDFEYLVAMDRHNYDALLADCPKMLVYKLKLFLDYAPHLGTKDLPDPYYGGSHGFEQVLDMVEDASRGLLQELRETELL